MLHLHRAVFVLALVLVLMLLNVLVLVPVLGFIEIMFCVRWHLQRAGWDQSHCFVSGSSCEGRRRRL